MATADKLLELIFCWIKEKEHVADNLRKLADELVLLRKKCNASECVGSTVTVAGAVSLIGAGVATFFSGGAASPLVVLASAYTGIGTTISLTTKIIENICSQTMEKVKDIEKKSNEIAKEIQQLFQKLKSEKKEVDPLSKPEELEHHIIIEILRAIARYSGLNVQIINDSVLNDMLHHMLQEFPLEKMISDMPSCGAEGRSSSAGTGRRSEGHSGDWTSTSDIKSSPQMTETCLEKQKIILNLLCSSVGFFSFALFLGKGKGKMNDALLALLRSTGFQAGVMVAGGVGILTFALPEMIDNWTEMIKGNHVTEASQSLKDTAYGIQNSNQLMKEQFKRIK